MTHQQDFVDPDAVRANLGDFLDSVDREPLTARMGHATWQITRAGDSYSVECYGRGGGWYASREMSRYELRQYLDAQEELELQRPESQRPGDSG